MPTHYQILGVPRSASKAEISAAYKKLALKYHPDNGSEPDSEGFKAVQEAYAILCDDEFRLAYDAHLKECKEKGSQDVFFTLASSLSSVAPASSEQSLVVRERFSLSDLIKRAGGMDTPSFIDILKNAELRTVEGLLDDDGVVKKLGGDYSSLYDIARHFGPAIKNKILNERRIYKYFGSYQTFRFAEFSAEDCSKVLSNSALNQKLDGQQLFKLATKFSAHASILKIITETPDLNKKYQAYFNLLHYSLPASGSPMVVERQKVSAWIEVAQINVSDVTGETFENAAVKYVLASDHYRLHGLDIDALNDLALADEKIALEIIETPVLLNKFSGPYLGALYLFRLSKKYLNVCTAVLKNPVAPQSLNGRYLFHLDQHHAKKEVHEAILSNPESKKRYEAYSQLFHYPSAQLILDAKEQQGILRLYRQANLDEAETEELLKNVVLALVLLNRNLVYGYRVIYLHPDWASYLVENHTFFIKAFESDLFIERLLGISKTICLQVLKKDSLAVFLKGKQLVEFCKKYGDEVFIQVLENPVLMDKYQAYFNLSRLVHQSGVRLEHGQREFKSTALMEAKSNPDYDRGVFLQEQGKFQLAFDYFHKAVQAGYEPASLAIKGLVPKLLQAVSSSSEVSIETIKKYAQIAKAFAEPKNPYYDESTATLIYGTVLRKERLPAGMVMEFWHIFARRLALGLGLGVPDKEQSNRIFSALVYGGTNNRQSLLTCCEADLRERRKIKAKMQERVVSTVFAEADDAFHEPALVFLQQEILICQVPDEKAQRYLELARFFHRVGGCVEAAQTSFERAIAISPASLTAADWFVLGSLQQSKAQALLEEKKQSDFSEEASPWNRPLSSFLQAAAVKKYSVKAVEEKDVKAENHAKLQAEICDAEQLALHLITLIYEKNPRGIVADNVVMILSNPSLCRQITLSPEMGPALLYAICLQLKPLVSPILPALKMSAVVSEPESLDSEGRSDYIVELVKWAGAEEKRTESESRSTAVNRLLVLSEMFLNGRNGERDPYQIYLQSCLSTLFETLELPPVDSEQNLAKQFFEAAKICKSSSSELQKSVAKALLQLACKLEIENLDGALSRIFFTRVHSNSPEDWDALCELIANLLDNQQDLYKSVFSRPLLGALEICVRLKPEYLYALHLQELRYYKLQSNCRSLPLPPESKSSPRENDYIIRLIDWAEAQDNAAEKIDCLLQWFLAGSSSDKYGFYADYCAERLAILSSSTSSAQEKKEERENSERVEPNNENLFVNALHQGCSIETIRRFAFNSSHDFSMKEIAYLFLTQLRYFPEKSPSQKLKSSSWEHKKAILGFLLEKWRASSTPPTPQNIIDFIFYAVHADSFFGESLSGTVLERESKRRELFALLIPPELIHLTFTSNYQAINDRLGMNYSIQLGDTLLHAIIRNSGNRNLCAFLFQQGADPNAANAVGDTPLILAIRSGHVPLIHLLLSQSGLLLEQTNNNRESACSIALYNAQFALAWLLISRSPIYWNRLLLGSAIALILLAGAAGALFFFYYTMPLPGLLCFWIAGLCLLLMSYPLFILPGAVFSKPFRQQELFNPRSVSAESSLPSLSLSSNLAVTTESRVSMGRSLAFSLSELGRSEASENQP